jgi:hypothetical protein
MQATELDALERQERFRFWRNCSGLGALISFALAVSAVWAAVGNPKTWSSAYSALATAGALGWLSVPLAVVGTILLVICIALTVADGRRAKAEMEVRK